MFQEKANPSFHSHAPFALTLHLPPFHFSPLSPFPPFPLSPNLPPPFA